MYHFQGSIIKALLHIYPDIGLDPTKFTRTLIVIDWLLVRFNLALGRYWHVLANRKRVFDKFAKHKQFDADNPDNWYLYTKQDIYLEKVPPIYFMFEVV